MNVNVGDEMPLIYRRSQASEQIEVLRAQGTVTTILAYGSGDNFTAPGTEFASDEEIMAAGTLVADDSANLTGVLMEIYLDGASVATTPLYGHDGTANFYQYKFGMLTEGTHVLEARFPRTRK